MAMYYNLPVYKTTYDLTLETFRVLKDFDREYKYILGDSIKEKVTGIMIDVYRANINVAKKDYIKEAREKVEELRMLFRLSRDLKQIKLSTMVSLNKKVESISKQLTAWQKVQ